MPQKNRRNVAMFANVFFLIPVTFSIFLVLLLYQFFFSVVLPRLWGGLLHSVFFRWQNPNYVCEE